MFGIEISNTHRSLLFRLPGSEPGCYNPSGAHAWGQRAIPDRCLHGNRTRLNRSIGSSWSASIWSNIGYATPALYSTADVKTARQAIELVSEKFGLVLIILGGMHFCNLYVFNRLRKREAGGSAPAISARRPAAFCPGVVMPPIRNLSIVYDAACRLCCRVKGWIETSAASGSARISGVGVRWIGTSVSGTSCQGTCRLGRYRRGVAGQSRLDCLPVGTGRLPGSAQNW